MWIIGLENTARFVISHLAQNNHPSTHYKDTITASKCHFSEACPHHYLIAEGCALLPLNKDLHSVLEQ